MSLNKTVSVIIPNYNYARFLQRRIDCIVNQTVKPNEIIFLDDCSTDNSLEIAAEILCKTNIPYQIIPNEVNQGVFKQWLKGIELAQCDCFWIAEADDYCELNFLETLLPAFDDDDVVISYCQSLKVNETGVEHTHKDWLMDVVGVHHWDCDYVNNAHDEGSYLAVISSIANASAVVVRKNVVNSSWSSLISQYKMAGDWLFYLLIVFNNSETKISYIAKTLNYWYQHDSSVWSAPGKVEQGTSECLNIYNFCLHHYQISYKSKMQIFKLLLGHYLKLEASGSSYANQVCDVMLLLGDETYHAQIKEFVQSELKSNNEINRLHQECANRDAEIGRLYQEDISKNDLITELSLKAKFKGELEILNKSYQLKIDKLIKTNQEQSVILNKLYYKINSVIADKITMKQSTVEAQGKLEEVKLLDEEKLILSSPDNIANIEAETHRLHQECWNRDREIDRLHFEINNRNDEILRLNNYIGYVNTSISWRITKPIRLVRKIVSIPKKLFSKIKYALIWTVKEIITIDLIQHAGKSFLNKYPRLKEKIKLKIVEKGLWYDDVYPSTPEIPMPEVEDGNLTIGQIRQQYGNDVANIYQILTKKKYEKNIN